MLVRIARVHRGAYDVLGPAGLGTVPALPPVTDPLGAPTVGDWLDLGTEPPTLQPRRSLVARGSAGRGSHAQPLAANVDTVLVCAGLHAPLPVRRLERLLALAWDSGATPVVLLTKADLCDDVPAVVAQAQRHAPGVEVAVTSALSGDVDALVAHTGPGATLVLLGASGAGKSSVVNALAGASVMATQQVREADGKGRHTTSHRELVVLPSGAVVIDTPGLRAVALQGGEDGLAQAFSDVEALVDGCRFTDCGHASEPGYAVTSAVADGALPAERLDSWRHLQRELAWQARRGDARLAAEERQRWKAIHVAQRQRGGRP